MLPSLDVFKNIPCPDFPNCQRSQCIFSHERPPVTNATIPNKRSRPSEQRQSHSNQTKTAKVRSQPSTVTKDQCTTRGSIASKKSIPGQTSKPSPINDDPTHRTAHVATFTGPPIIKADISSHTALKIRQTISNKLYEQYVRIHPTSTTTAARHTQEKERSILTMTMNTAGYKQQAMSILMQLKKQQPQTTETSESEVLSQSDDVSLDPSCLGGLTLTNEQLDVMQYPPLTLLDDTPVPGEKQSQQQTCDRCKKTYTVKALLDNQDVKACQYHYGRLRVAKSFGEKLRTYTCCDEPLGAIGCEKGPHVFKDDQVDKLHGAIAFIKVPPPTTAVKEMILALDCEMGYTTIGMELIRLTVINGRREKVLDELVLPSHMVIDLNTRYSGITTLAGVKHNLVSIRQALFDLMNSDTILVGHGLENDLKALRIIHDKVIDTAALYPHPHGLPYRYGLRALATKYLSKFIQTGSDGHDSYEDAGTCLELLYEYIKKHHPSSHVIK